MFVVLCAIYFLKFVYVVMAFVHLMYKKFDMFEISRINDTKFTFSFTYCNLHLDYNSLSYM